MKIKILVEGRTEVAFKPYLIEFLKNHLQDRMPRLKFWSYDGRIPKEEKLQRVVANLLSGRDACDHVIALTDVYTGTPDFDDAEDAKLKMRHWVGDEERFHPHVANHDFEAWLLPYWHSIQRLTGQKRNAPTGAPETVNHTKPPAYRIKEIFELGVPHGNCRSYVKPRDAGSILRENDLSVTINACPELKLFVNTIITLSGGIPL